MFRRMQTSRDFFDFENGLDFLSGNSLRASERLRGSTFEPMHADVSIATCLIDFTNHTMVCYNNPLKSLKSLLSSTDT